MNYCWLPRPVLLLLPFLSRPPYQEAVAALLETYINGGDAHACLARVPNFSTEIAEATWATMQHRLQAAVAEYVGNNITGANAVYLAAPFWRTCFLSVAVLFESLERNDWLANDFLYRRVLYIGGKFVEKGCDISSWQLPLQGQALGGGNRSTRLWQKSDLGSFEARFAGARAAGLSPWKTIRSISYRSDRDPYGCS